MERGATFVAIGGGTGSGKSTLARRISAALEAPILRMDDYYRAEGGKDLAARRAVNYDHPASVEHTLLLAQMTRLARGETIEKPVYDFARHDRSALVERVGPAPVVLVEGIFALAWAEIAAMCPVRLFVAAPEGVRFARRLRRDVEERGRDAAEVRQRLSAHVMPMHALWVEPSRSRATRVVSGEGCGKAMLALAVEDIEAAQPFGAPVLL